ncbi:MAG: aldose 1-epimerase [Hyphomonas sp.]|nr:aldose 1-epimerase [Hyphomonas sp.]
MDVVISRDGLRLSLLPQLGGSVRAFTWHGQDILYPAAAPVPVSPLNTAGFPMFPFSGRINGGRFQWHGKDVALRPNFAPEAHAIHGQAWLEPWTVAALEPDAVRLSYEHGGDDWPWRYRAIQDFKLLEDGLCLTLTLENLSDTPMPAGLGWHPYFPRGDAVLKANVSGIWTADSGMIPDRVSPLGPGTDLREPVEVDSLSLDNAFTAAPADATIDWPGAGIRVRMKSSGGLGHLIVYVPPNQDFFCVEPASHAPDALNSTRGADVTGIREIGPGGAMSEEIRLQISRISAGA